MASAASFPSAPVGVVLIGHSYVRRLQDFMNEDSEFFNMGFPHRDANVRSFARGGASLRLQPDDHWINCHLQPALTSSPRPSIVVLHVGENDLRHLTPPEIVDHMWALVSYIASVSHPHVILVSQLLWFLCNEDLHEQITYINTSLQDRIQQYTPAQLPGRPLTQVQLLRHQFGIWGASRQELFQRDGVHLNNVGLRRYYYSVRNAVGQQLRHLLQQ